MSWLKVEWGVRIKGSVEIERIIDRENIITKQLTSKLTEFVPNVHRKQTMRDLRD